MNSSERLAKALEEADLPEMAAKARKGYYNDFKSPLVMPAMQLAKDLEKAGTPAALALRRRHVKYGEFDGK
jgi:hypothetical protein